MSGGSYLTCGACGERVLNDTAEQREPCPSCGSLIRTHSIVGSGGIRFGGSAPARGFTYVETLLASAQRFHDAGDYSVAVIVAHMACEIAVAQTLDAVLSAKGGTELRDAIGELLVGYNLASDRVRKLYVTLTGDQVQLTAFWQAFKASARCRNVVVHGGRPATREEGERSVQVAKQLVAHLLP